MDNGRIAAAVVGGYLLGRTKKMKFAIMIGGALMGKKIPTDPAGLLKLAGSVVDKSPELQRLDAAVRGRLMDAGKDAALSVASSRMEAFTDSLVNRVENLGKPAAEAPAGGAAEDAEDIEDGEFEDLDDTEDTKTVGTEDEDEGADPTAEQTSRARNGSSSRNGSSARNGSGNGSSARNGSTARNGSGNGSAARNGSSARTGSRRTARPTAEASHD